MSSAARNGVRPKQGEGWLGLDAGNSPSVTGMHGWSSCPKGCPDGSAVGVQRRRAVRGAALDSRAVAVGGSTTAAPAA